MQTGLPAGDTKRTWYGWQIILAAGASGALFAGAEIASDQSIQIVLGTFAYLTSLFSGPGIHYLNGRSYGVSRLSLQIAGAGGALGILGGALAARGQRSLPYAQDIAIGCEVGLLAGMLVDSLALGWKRTSDSGPVATWTIRLERGGGASAGLVGAF